MSVSFDLRTDAAPSSYPDVYFTPGYGAAVASAEGATWHLAHASDRMMVPYLVRPVADGISDAASPYGYSGVHINPDIPRSEVNRVWSLLLEHWRDSGLVTVFLRFSPLEPGSVEVMRTLGLVPMTRRADTVTVAVSQGSGTTWDRLAGRCRTAIRKARRVGMEASVRPVEEADLTAGSTFRRLYERTMTRVGSSPSYIFPDRYYRMLLDGLGKALLIGEVRDRDGMVVASTLLMQHADRVHYHLAGSDTAAARSGANNLLLWTVFEWAANCGYAWVHLGGGVRADDSLFQFKRSFGGARTEFWTGSLVLDKARYDALVAQHAARLDRPPTELLDSGFFPAYRWEVG
ncbi:Acetyltransferase (GNAT) domain-containing protein [Micromonospora rhizosphaerae]|uniref:Acetyltransferase (GNAT) domain-containing protein n=1 Tax=Micromonospora rhizosphaerae TaxID=568872 RepID=A0A1C6S3U0_9ACTN|nr:GNAT family N-acetyltransferase [Micromonospora rhizosphaerae]SCL24036.1 Acetyltransferase (GNAT) domain-containing protein [Micromonospora rhizosphaerae]